MRVAVGVLFLVLLLVMRDMIVTVVVGTDWFCMGVGMGVVVDTGWLLAAVAMTAIVVMRVGVGVRIGWLLVRMTMVVVGVPLVIVGVVIVIVVGTPVVMILVVVGMVVGTGRFCIGVAVVMGAGWLCVILVPKQPQPDQVKQQPDSGNDHEGRASFSQRLGFVRCFPS